VGGVAPTKLIAAGATVTIKHEVTVDLTDDIQLYGTLNILGDTLRFPAIFTKRTTIYTSGVLRVLNGGFIQDLPANQCEVEIREGKVFIENSRVHIGKHFKNIDGSRSIRNSWVKVGETYEADGTSTLPARDSIQYSTLEVNVSHAGRLEIKDDSYLSVANARVFVLDGDFKTANRGFINTLSGAASRYGFDLLKTFTHLDIDGPWDARIYAHCVDGDIKGSRVADIDFTRAEDCTLPPPPPASPAGQMVMNEVYTDPGDGKDEFVELYNINNQPENMNNYTLVTHFNDGVQKGFFVLDLPNMVAPAKGFFVASSTFPLNYQGWTGSTNSSFDWNKAGEWQEASLKKWVFTGGTGNLMDGNISYDLAPLPATGLNNFFYRVNGDVAYTFLLFKNGVLVNRIIAGAGGVSTLSSSITSLPRLYIDMAGTAPDFTINFANYVGLPVEKITSDAGNDNGFTRSADGACGSFRKSSTAIHHTPMQSNGPVTVNSTGDVTVNATVTRGTDALGSVLNYTVQAAPNYLPAELRIIVDDGTVPGQLDAMDTQLDYQTATYSGQAFTLTYQPFDKDIFILVKQGSGCIDRLVMASPQDARFVTLPVNFIGFKAIYSEGVINLKWATEGEEINHFVVERSSDGRSFTIIGIVFPDDKMAGSYQLNDRNVSETAPSYYYRIKAVYSAGKAGYSTIQSIRLADNTALAIASYPNPVKNNLTVTLPTQWQNKDVRYEVYSANGGLVHSASVVNSSTTVQIDMSAVPSGMYLLRLFGDGQSIQQRIIKN
jgi:hypothetical protein